jgi:hypothetical protein
VAPSALTTTLVKLKTLLVKYQPGMEKLMSRLVEDAEITDHRMFMTFSMSQLITMKIVLENPDKPWDYDCLSMCPGITWDDIVMNPDKPWNYKFISQNPNITWSHVRTRLNAPWNFGMISMKEDITMKIVLENPGKNWSYMALSENPGITWDDIVANPDKPWCYSYISRNPNVTMDIVAANPDKPWSYCFLSQNPNITWQFVMSCPDKRWDYFMLSKNPNITWQIVCDNPDKPWHYFTLSLNPNITTEIVNGDPDKPWEEASLILNPSVDYTKIRNKIRSEGSSENLHISQIARNPNYTLSELWYLYKKYNRIDNQKIFYFLYQISYNKFCHDPYFRSSIYRKSEAKRRHNQMYSELIQRACHTSRLFSWNEGAAEQMPDEYAEECRRWREMRFVKTQSRPQS